MAKELIWTKRANVNFNKIIAYLENEWGEKVTENFVKKTYTILELLTDQPEIGTLEHQNKNIRGFPLSKHTRLFYRITDKEIIFINFFDSRSDPKKRRI